MPLQSFEITTTAREGKFINYFSAAPAGGIENMNNGLLSQFISKMPPSLEADRRKYVYAISEMQITVTDRNSLSLFLDPTQRVFTHDFSIPEFFHEEDINDNGYLKTNLLQTALQVTISGLPGLSLEDKTQLYESGEGMCSVRIIAYPFETHIKEYGNNVTVVYVNGAFNSAQDYYPHEEHGTAGTGLKILDEFMANVPTLPQKQLVYIFNNGPTAKSGKTILPRDDLTIELNLRNAAASVNIIGMDAFPETVLPNRTPKYFRLANSVTANDNFHAFDPTIDGKVSGRNALIASRIKTNWDDPFDPTFDQTSAGPGNPGGIHIIKLYKTNPANTLSHEFAHIIGDLDMRGNKYLGNILHAYPANQNQIDNDKAYKSWCSIQFEGSDLTPRFDEAHPRPQKARIFFPSSNRVLSICPVVQLKLEFFGGGVFPVDVTQMISYADHPLLMSGTVLEIAGNRGASSRQNSYLGSTLFEFYVLAGAIYRTTLEKIEKVYDQRSAFYISNKSAYAGILNKVKKTKNYTWIELVNYGVDNLSDFFTGSETDKQISDELQNFIDLRPEYDLSYSDTTLGDADILKRNNYQSDESAHAEADKTGMQFLSHVSSETLSMMGFIALGENDGTIEVYKGQPVQTRIGGALINIPKIHHLVISKAKEDTIEDLETVHRTNSSLTKTEEQQAILQIYNGTLAPHKLCFPKADGTGEEDKFVYIIVKFKTDVKTLEGVTITDSIGRSMNIT